MTSNLSPAPDAQIRTVNSPASFPPCDVTDLVGQSPSLLYPFSECFVRGIAITDQHSVGGAGPVVGEDERAGHLLHEQGVGMRRGSERLHATTRQIENEEGAVDVVERLVQPLVIVVLHAARERALRFPWACSTSRASRCSSATGDSVRSCLASSGGPCRHCVSVRRAGFRAVCCAWNSLPTLQV